MIIKRNRIEFVLSHTIILIGSRRILSVTHNYGKNDCFSLRER